MPPKILTTDGADSITEPESDAEIVTPSVSTPATLATAATVSPADNDSITEPESDAEIVTPSMSTPATLTTAATVSPADDDSITEPESDAEIVTPSVSTPTTLATAATVSPADDNSITEPESDAEIVTPCTDPGSTTIPPRLDRLTDSCSFFTTPSPPPSDSIYWKYITREEDSKWYDRAGTDSSFSTVRQWKQELRALMDK
jgi:hypothetical protein